MKYITEAILYNSCGMEIDRKQLDTTDIGSSLATILRGDWTLSEGDTISIVSSGVC